MNKFALTLDEFTVRAKAAQEKYYQYGCGFQQELEYIDASLSSDDMLWYSHETGGVHGGSCWDSSNPRPYVCHDPDPGFKALNDLLEEVAPTLSFIKYRQLASMVKQINTRVNEYYGNRTEYKVEYIAIKDLYQFLEENA